MYAAMIGVLRTLGMAFIGGAVFYGFGLPLPWLAGAMIAVGLAAVAGIKVGLPQPVRWIGFVILGLQIGASVTLEALGRIVQWPIGAAVLVVTLLGIIGLAYHFYRRAMGWSPETALLASVPGALALILSLAPNSRTDVAAVSATQILRVFLLVFLLPLALSPFLHEAPVDHLPAAAGLAETALILIFGAAGGVLGHLMRLPAGILLGAMSVNALLHLTGLFTAALPPVLLVFGFLIFGSNAGANLTGLTFAVMRRLAMASFGGFILVSAVAFLGAVVTAGLTQISLPVAILAFAPGGFEIMVIIAFTLGLDATFVTAMHLLRYLAISFGLPVYLAFFLKKLNS